jgi:tetratricopeptide (TPR) repeat protein
VIKPLAPPDSHHLLAAQGWIELGNHTEANEELKLIAPEFRAHPDVLDVRWHIYAHLKNWEDCLSLAETVVRLVPDRVDGWIHRSFALHELKRTQEALDQLAPVVGKFPKVWTIPYNLACYCAQLGKMEQCKSWFEAALAIDSATVKRAAREDPDLKPLRSLLGPLFWKQKLEPR